VVGTRARRALTATLMGSTSLEVARRATRPVLMVNLPRRRRFR
jgi:nucleotide-binding universal stress UspA family protein